MYMYWVSSIANDIHSFYKYKLTSVIIFIELHKFINKFIISYQ